MLLRSSFKSLGPPTGRIDAFWSCLGDNVLCRRHLPLFSSYRHVTTDATAPLPDQLRLLMRRVQQPVVLVTTEFHNGSKRTKRGLTVSSFTTICLTPAPFVCFSTRQNSRAASLISQRKTFVIHLLPCIPEAARLAEAFSRSDLAPTAASDLQNPFELGVWRFNEQWELPLYGNALGFLLCTLDRTVDVGDHRLLIAEVRDVAVNEGIKGTALGYCERVYRGEGDPIWSHERND